MKVLLVLFLVFIPYSYSLQYITLGDTSLKNLTSSTSNDHFYISVPANKDLHLVLIDNNYHINNIDYCFAYSNSYPTESTISSCGFSSLSHYASESTFRGKEYYYKKSTIPNYNYIIIRYSGRDATGKIKAGAAIAYMKEVRFGLLQIKLPRTSNGDAYFYTSIYSGIDYVYFNLTDTSRTYKDFDTKLYCCLTKDNPINNYLKVIRNCIFNQISPYNTGKTFVNYEYYYRYPIGKTDKDYIIIRYNYNSDYYSLYAESSTYEFKGKYKTEGLPTVSIVFIVIASVAIACIMITIICYYYRKRAVNNIPTASTPLVEKNSIIPINS